MSTRTIAQIAPTPNQWTNPKNDKTSFFLKGDFIDGDGFSVWCSSMEAFQKAKDALTPLIGQEHEFGVENPKEYQGKTTWQLKSYPGQQVEQRSGGGGRAPFVPKHRDTAEGAAEERQSIHRSVALQQAVAHCVGAESGFVLGVADEFFAWLQGGARAAGSGVGQQAAKDGNVGAGADPRLELSLALTRCFPIDPKDQEARLSMCEMMMHQIRGSRPSYKKASDLQPADAGILLADLKRRYPDKFEE